ncbi:MAG: hypothetical protein GY803_19415 [Chloroflexi bacterium]|nr:hypothetical protein [Chloroflexota bacterium]
MSKTAVTSFVIRFKQEQASSSAAPPWRGLIRHVQTSQEAHFTHIEDALSFMAQFVKIPPGSAGILPA